MYLFTCLIQVSHHTDVIHISLRSSVEQHRTMYASIVEEIKVDVLHKKPSGYLLRNYIFACYLLVIHWQVHMLISPKHYIKPVKARIPGIREHRLMSKVRNKRGRAGLRITDYISKITKDWNDIFRWKCCDVLTVQIACQVWERLITDFTDS